jgi:hypothetical protein
MNLDLPTVSVTLGPDWAIDINEAFETIDTHDHTSGKGKKITPAALNINSSLSFNNYPLTNLNYINLYQQTATLVGPSLVYNVNGDLYYNNGSGVPVQITSGGSVVTAPSSTQVLERIAVNVDTVIGPSATPVIYEVDTSAPRVITLPLSSAVVGGRIYLIVDATRQSEINTLTIAASGADTINGASSITVQSNGASVFLEADGVNKYTII